MKPSLLIIYHGQRFGPFYTTKLTFQKLLSQLEIAQEKWAYYRLIRLFQSPSSLRATVQPEIELHQEIPDGIWELKETTYQRIVNLMNTTQNTSPVSTVTDTGSHPGEDALIDYITEDLATIIDELASVHLKIRFQSVKNTAEKQKVEKLMTKLGSLEQAIEKHRQALDNHRLKSIAGILDREKGSQNQTLTSGQQRLYNARYLVHALRTELSMATKQHPIRAPTVPADRYYCMMDFRQPKLQNAADHRAELIRLRDKLQMYNREVGGQPTPVRRSTVTDYQDHPAMVFRHLSNDTIRKQLKLRSTTTQSHHSSGHSPLARRLLHIFQVMIPPTDSHPSHMKEQNFDRMLSHLRMKVCECMTQTGMYSNADVSKLIDQLIEMETTCWSGRQSTGACHGTLFLYPADQLRDQIRREFQLSS